MSKRELAALQEKGIGVGDTVRTAFRGGVREGKVEKITNEPKVVFTRKRPGQKDKTVAHNPSTLEKVQAGMKDSEELAKATGAAQRSRRGRRAKGGKKAGPGVGQRAGSGKKASGGPNKAPTEEEGGSDKAAGGSAHSARHSSRIATRRHRHEAGTSEAVAGEEKVGYRRRSAREE